MHPALQTLLAPVLLAALAAAPLQAEPLCGDPGGPGADPFSPGARWEYAPQPSAPWIARDVAFVEGGELVWAAPAVGTPHLALFAAGGDGSPLHADATLGSATGAVRVAVGRGSHELYALARLPGPTADLRRSVLARYDARAVALGVPFVPVWEREVAAPSAGATRLAADPGSGVIVLAAADPAQGRVQVDWVGSAGELLERRWLPAGDVGRLAVSAGAGRVALIAGGRARVLERATGLELYSAALGTTTTEVLAFSRDGARLLHGEAGAVRLVEDAGAGYQTRALLLAQAGEVPTRGALAVAGDTVAVAWWNAVDGRSVRLEVVDPAGAPLFEYTQPANAEPLQNFPEGLAITADGSRLALALWGAGDARPELLLFDRGSATPRFQENYAGSPGCLALDEGGTRVALGVKDVHANQLGTTGRVRLFDTGERDLTVVGAPSLGGRLCLLAEREGALAAWFLFGQPGTPAALPGLSGSLGVDPAGIVVWGAPIPEPGRPALELAIPFAPSLVGLELAVQGVFLDAQGAGFSAALAHPRVLAH